MIQFEDLDLICRVDNHFYKLVVSGWSPDLYAKRKCALAGTSLCGIMPCVSYKFKMFFHYEEISDETMAAMRRLCDER